jgi:hypothetical protein
MSEKLEELVSTALEDTEDGVLAGQALALLMADGKTQSHLTDVSPIVYCNSPNTAIRQQLQQRPLVYLESNQQEASLTESMYHDIVKLSDDLKLDETHVLSLYAHMSVDHVRAELESRFGVPDEALMRNIPLAVETLYWHEQALPLITLRSLLQHRLRAEPGHVVLQVTDDLLQDKLWQSLLEWVRVATRRITEWNAELSRLEPPATHGTSPQSAHAQTLSRHARFHVEQRQLAAECLYFWAYFTQLEATEVAALIDLAKELSNELPVLDPYIDVPSPVIASDPTAVSSPWRPFGTTMHALEKDPLTWQRELIQQTCKTTHVDRLQVISTLVVAILTSLDSRGLKHNRKTHCANDFGTGNALLPPNSSTIDSLHPIHQRLSQNATDGWKRKDIFGLLACSFALLLQSTPSAVASPRAGPVSPGSSIDIRKAFRESLKAPETLGSFTMARLTLLPGLRSPSLLPSPACDAVEFYLATLTEFVSFYLEVLDDSGDRPISKAKWLQDAEEDLRLRRTHDDHIRQFETWAGGHTSAGSQMTSIAEVDLGSRPDCMDDVVALAVSVCALGPEYALPFWSTAVDQEKDGEEIQKLVPSNALKGLERQQSEDDTLRAPYLSMLSALALAKDEFQVTMDGATAVHRILSHDRNTGVKGHTWVTLIENLRWYARELDPQQYGSNVSKYGKNDKDSSNGTSTQYYYYSENLDGSERQDSEDTNNDPTSTRPKELGEDNTNLLLSILATISNVGERCPEARETVLSVNIPVYSSDGNETVGQDSALMILFTLATMPVAPGIRGAIFSTIASLLNDDACHEGQARRIQDFALQGWETLDACQILPIYLLEQYPTFRDAESKSFPGLAFPPSSTGYVDDKPGKSWIPANSMYAIIYELEFVESVMGFYPSSEGLLKLLNALFQVGGCPKGLGKARRVRPGCSPYIEFACHFILPRATGRFGGLGKLPFRSLEDESRLVALALELVKTVLTHYICPVNIYGDAVDAADKSQYMSAAQSAAKQALLHSRLVKSLVQVPLVGDAKHFAEDFPSQVPDQVKTAGVSVTSKNKPMPIRSHDSISASVPRTQSPGFLLLVETLSSNQGDLFNSLVAVVSQSQTMNAFGKNSDCNSKTYALFGAKRTILTGKSKEQVSSFANKSNLKQLEPNGVDLSYDQAVYWRERSVILALECMCAVVAREDCMYQATSTLSSTSIIVPVIHFRRKAAGSSRLKFSDYELTTFADLLVSAETDTGVVSSIVSLVGYISSNESRDLRISTAAVSLVLYVDRSIRNGFGSIIGSSPSKQRALSRAFAHRVLLSSQTDQAQDMELLRIVCERILLDLRRPSQERSPFAGILLGLSNEDLAPDEKSPNDCFGAFTQILKKKAFVTSSKSGELAASIFEIFFHLCNYAEANSGDAKMMLKSSSKLRKADFWLAHLSLILSNVSSIGTSSSRLNTSVFHSIAWILKGIANELRLLTDFSGVSTVQDSFLGPQPSKYRRIVSVLCNENSSLLLRLLDVMPIRRLYQNTVIVAPTEESVRFVKKGLYGAPSVVNGYDVVDTERLLVSMRQTKESIEEGLRNWCDHWNLSVARDCASAHCSDALRIVLGTINIADTTLGIRTTDDNVRSVKLLLNLLELVSSSGPSSSAPRDMDMDVYTTATRNLALAILSTTELVFKSASKAVSDTPGCATLLARAICQSGFHLGEGPDACRRNERTAILANALACILRRFSEEDTSKCMIEDFRNAALVLSRLSTFLRAGEIPPTQAVLARWCLSAILGLFARQDTSRELSFVQSVLTDPIRPGAMHSTATIMIKAISSRDVDMALLLQKIALLPFGGETLLESGVLEAMYDVAKYYFFEEAKFLKDENASTMMYQRTEVGVPSFLIGHLELMISLLLSGIEETRKLQIAVEVLQIIQLYQPTVNRLLSGFPVDGEVLETFYRTYCQAKLLIDQGDKGFRKSTSFSNCPQMDEYTEYENGLVHLTMHLVEYPLPRSMLTSLPAHLEKHPSQAALQIVENSLQTVKSWWSSLDIEVHDSSSEWLSDSAGLALSDMICELASRGGDMARVGLSLIRRSESNSIADVQSLCRGLTRCSYGVRVRISAAFQSEFFGTFLLLTFLFHSL